MTNYQNGYAFERKVATDLEGDGYFVVQSRGSHGIADLVAVKPGQVLIVQCKATGAIGVDEWNRLHAQAEAVAAVPLVAFRPARGNRPERGNVAYWMLTAQRVPRRPVSKTEPEYVDWVADEVSA